MLWYHCHARRRWSARRRNCGVCRGECGMSANRRDFIKFVVAERVTAGCPMISPLVAAQTGMAPRAHTATWTAKTTDLPPGARQRSNFFTRPPPPTQLVIIGGGDTPDSTVCAPRFSSAGKRTALGRKSAISWITRLMPRTGSAFLSEGTIRLPVFGKRK